ncbi:carboxypeptidase regulatory-like domain-containing protein [Pedobacter mucosus]|uniref:carboxypeptidase regulatory-like domain-containing protein n=1 Tax=Pedobacter mucosus TaxID=2895286 RepID=UPI001EE46BBD|nr:carboxypeptidase regulatory-like domain-containing protein [Pedobacter mucosus]UKT62954.1 carboxypeptidase regulatory-like domain-containing protein [Pedobacter mucosus]
MKIFKVSFIVIALLSILHFTSSAQTDTISINTIISKTNKVLNDFPAEKIHLHFDKPYYAVADTVWFKAYVTENQNFLSGISKIIYVDVINQNDSLIQTLKLPITGGLANGNFPLDQVNYKQGNYHIRAYTMWMLNFESPAYFNKTFFVGEAIDKEVKTHVSYKNLSTDKQEKIDARIQFKDANNKPYVNKNVSWQVVTSFTVIAKGRGTTDANGYLTISMTANQKAEYQLQKGELITSINTTEKDVASSTFQLQNAIISKDFQLFPEGGKLVAGITNKVAFKGIKSDGLGIGSKGTISDNDGKTLVTFTDQHLGMGSFNMIAETGKTYKANVTFTDGTTQIFDLPAVTAAGISINIENSNAENIAVKIIANDEFFKLNEGKKYYLIAQSKGVICYGAQTALTTKEFNTTILKSKFPVGIAQFTLFEENGTPLNERLVFIQHKNNLTLTVSSPLASYGIKKKVKINLLAKKDGAPVEGNFSVAVIDETKVPSNEDASTTILTSLLLSSDLKGYVEKPNYYFNNTDAKKAADLDVLLLTQGYRSFRYPDIIKDKIPKFTFLPEQGIEISGILRMTNGIPVRKGALLLTIPDKRFNLEGITDPVGNFKFQNLVLNDSSKVTISAKYNVNYKSMAISVTGVPVPTLSRNFSSAEEVLNIDSAMTTYLDNSRKQYAYLHTLKDVTIKAASVPKVSHKDYPALTGLSQIADHEISGDRLTGCNLLINCLQTMMPGVTFVDNQFYVSRDYNAGNKTPMAVFINGMNVDVNQINTLTANDIESIEIFLRDELGLVNRAYNVNGVIVINQKKAPKGTKISKSQLMDMLPKNYEVTFSPQGYNKEKQFYSPRYDVAANMNRNDLRTTIYWNPKVITDAAGNASFEFYNADGRGQYKVIVEGIDGSGNLGRSIFKYSVK